MEQSRGSQGLKGNITAWVLNKMKCFIDSPYKEVSGNQPTNPPKIPSFLLGPSDSDCSDPFAISLHILGCSLCTKIPLW